MTLSNYLLIFIVVVFKVSNSNPERNAYHLMHGNRNRKMNNEVDYTGHYDNQWGYDFSQPNSNPDQGLDNCTQCNVAREEKKRRRIESIKAQILSTLGLDAPPNITNARNLSASMLTDYMMNDNPNFQPYHEENIQRNKHVRFYKYSKRRPPGIQSDEGNVLQFTFNDISKSSTVIHAMLKVFVRYPSMFGSYGGPVSIELHKVTHSNRRTRQKRFVQYFDTNIAWVHINVTNLVNRCIRTSKTLGLLVTAVGNNNEEFEIVNPSENESDEYAPFLDFRTIENVRSRNKRKASGLICSEKSKEDRCCRWPLVVNFSDFGWYFIIQPRIYHANYCDGSCAVSSVQKYQHSHIVLQAQGFESCCIATKMHSLDMIFHKDEDTIVKGNIADMIAERCMCA